MAEEMALTESVTTLVEYLSFLPSPKSDSTQTACYSVPSSDL